MPLISSYSHGQFCWAELVAKDMPSAILFYNNVMNWKTTDLNASCDDSMPHVQFESLGQPVAGLIQMNESLREAGLPSVWNSYVCVDDLEFSLDKAVQLGGRITCPATSAGEHGLIGFVQDPTGGIIGLWQKGTHGGESLRGDINAVCWNELASRNSIAACEFYSALFGWTFRDNPMAPAPYFIIQSADGEEIGGIMQMTDDWGDMPSHWTIYFNVEEVDATAAKVQEMDGALVIAPFDTPVGRIAVMADNQAAAFNVIRLEMSPTVSSADSSAGS